MAKCFERHGQFLQGCKALRSNKELFEIPEEALHATIAFRFLNRRARIPCRESGARIESRRLKIGTCDDAAGSRRE